MTRTDWPLVAALLGMCAVGAAAIFQVGEAGLTVAAAVVGGIAGWLTRDAKPGPG